MPIMPDMNDSDTRAFNDRWNAIHHNYLEPPLLNDVNAKLAFEPEDREPYEKSKTEALAMVWDAMPPNMVQADKVAAMTRAHAALAQSYMKHGLTQDMQAAALRALSTPVPLLTTLERELLAALKEAAAVIKVWHGPAAWDIYYRASPEMKRINAAIAKAEGRS